MTDVSDMELLRDYSRKGSEEAFAALVRRHINLVYSASFRHLGSTTHAEEITQAVFIVLARKAASLRSDTILEGWLYETTRLTASSFLRGERRRQWREQEAYMQSKLQDSPDSSAWNQLAPLLDEAMAGLRGKDRDAVILRFFKEKNLHEVAAALQVNEAAAQKRVHRAVEKLRLFFSKRGVVVSGLVITGSISANSVQAAPVALAHSVTVAAIAKGAAASSSTLTLIKGTLKIMAWAKAKLIVAASVAVLLAAGTTVVVVEKVGSSGVDESIWAMDLDKAPAALIISPTRFADTSGESQWKPNGKIIGHNIDLNLLLQFAYSCRSERMVLPNDIPHDGMGGGFDLMLTLPTGQKAALRKKIREQFGFIGRHEIVVTNVFYLKVKDAGRLEAHRSKLASRMSWTIPTGLSVYSNYPISHLAQTVEWRLRQPVLIQGKCAGNYDFTLRWPKTHEQKQQFMDEDLADLGLELVPSTAALEMVVVKKTNSKTGLDTFLTPLAESDYRPQTNSVLQGTWEGMAMAEQAQLPVNLRIAERGYNTFRAEADLPALQQTNAQAVFFTFSPPTVIIDFREMSATGMEPVTVFEGNLDDSGQEIKGNLTYQGAVWPLTLKRSGDRN